MPSAAATANVSRPSGSTNRISLSTAARRYLDGRIDPRQTALPDAEPLVEQAIFERLSRTARNLPYYPADVTLTGIGLSEQMFEIGRRRTRELGRDADLHLGDAQSLDFPDESFDTVVCTLGLRTIPEGTCFFSNTCAVRRSRFDSCKSSSNRWPSASLQTT